MSSSTTPSQSDPPTQTKPQGEKQTLVKLTILCYRNPKLSEAEFHHHWTNIHAPKVSAHLAKFGITGYRQHHTPSTLRSSLSTKVPSLGIPIDSEQWADYDGFVELLMPELECYERARTDQYYLDVVVPDEEMFADLGRSRVAVGWEEVWVEGVVVKDARQGQGEVGGGSEGGERE